MSTTTRYATLSIATAFAGALLTSPAFAGNGKGATPNGKPFVELQGQIIEVEGEVSTLQDQVDALVDKVDNLEGRVGADEAAIAALEAQSTALQDQLDANAGDISSLEAEIVSVQNNNAGLQDQIDALGDADGALQAEIDANEALITTLASTIDTLDGDLQAQIDNNTALIDLLDDEIATITQSLALKQQIIDGQCPAGSAIYAVNPDGSVACESIDSGATGISRIVVSNVMNVQRNAINTIAVACPADYVVTGGGHHGWSTEVWDSRPGLAQGDTEGNGWFVGQRNTATFDLHVGVYAICISLQGS